MAEMTRIVHPTDFSSEAEVAEAEAAKLARAIGAELVLVHVSVETPFYSETGFGTEDLHKLYAEQATWAEARLTERVERLVGDGLRARWRRTTGVPHEEIVKAAVDEHAAYIVIGTHGRGGVGRLMLGSVADRVIRSAMCPVVSVRS
jgi:nucleotide-binding universal stress UspA family protein